MGTTGTFVESVDISILIEKKAFEITGTNWWHKWGQTQKGENKND